MADASIQAQTYTNAGAASAYATTNFEQIVNTQGLSGRLIIATIVKDTGDMTEAELVTVLKALERAGISDFRWHDLRHTWASWHVQNGTPLHELQQLGGWSTYEMVLRYAHLSSEHLRTAAERIHDVSLPA
jgi:integrase